MEQVIQDWGYYAVFLGAMFEGESVILTASFLAHQGYFSLYKLIVIAFFGSLIADQVLYYVGRNYGDYILNRFPSWRKRSDRAFRLLRRYGNTYILTFRFIYGIRTVSPIIIGVAGINPLRYAVLNVIAAAIWSVLSCCAGYFLADLLMDSLEMIPKIMLGFVAFIVIAIYGVYKYKNSQKEKEEI